MQPLQARTQKGEYRYSRTPRSQPGARDPAKAAADWVERDVETYPKSFLIAVVMALLIITGIASIKHAIPQPDK